MGARSEMIADLHCHYPMHLLPKDDHPLGATKGFLHWLKDEFDARAVAIAGHFLNNPHWWQDWRVNLERRKLGILRPRGCKRRKRVTQLPTRYAEGATSGATARPKTRRP